MSNIHNGSRRLHLQRVFVEDVIKNNGKIVNLGCGEDPAQLQHANITHVDLDTYNHQNFVRADICNLPFEDNEFDLAILGDILEHAPNPVTMLKESSRVAKRVIATVFEEWRLPHDGLNIEWAKENIRKDMTDRGFTNITGWMRSQPTIQSTLIDVDEKTSFDRLPHIWQFTEEILMDIIKQAELDIIIFSKFEEYRDHEDPNQHWNNWLIVLRKCLNPTDTKTT